MNTLDLNKLDYFEVECLSLLVESRIESIYKFKDRCTKIESLNKKKNDELEELTILKVKLCEFLKTMKEPSTIERYKARKTRR